MEGKKYNLIIIGAGPAGSMAAKTAAELDLSVLIVESRLQIGVPVQCAEGVSEKQLDKLIDVKPRHIAKKIKGFEIYSPDKTKVFVNGNGYVLERKIFDRWLAEKAIKAGAEIIIGAKAIGLAKNEKDIAVKIKSSEKEYNLSADIVIGADGPASIVGKWAGINTDLDSSDVMVCQQFIAAGIENLDCAECYMGNEIAPAGYAWVFPKSENTANVGMGIPSEKIKSGISVLEYLKKFVGNRFPNCQIIEETSGGVPVGLIKNIVADKTILVGDAARIVNPISGGGIINGMKSGIAAAEIAKEAIARGDTSANKLSEYEKIIWEEFNKTNEKLLKVKKVVQKLTDEELNQLARSLKDINFSEIYNMPTLIKQLVLKNPRMLFKLRSLI
jgi:digeranylgeranylglycerophospholipid reductase